MAMRRFAHVASRRWIVPPLGETSARVGGGGVGERAIRAGGAQTTQRARFWNWFLGSKDGADERDDDEATKKKRKGDARGDDADDAAAAPARSGADDSAPGGSPFSRAMRDAATSDDRDASSSTSSSSSSSSDDDDNLRDAPSDEVRELAKAMRDVARGDGDRGDDRSERAERGDRGRDASARSRDEGKRHRSDPRGKQKPVLFVRNVPSHFNAKKLAELFDDAEKHPVQSAKFKREHPEHGAHGLVLFRSRRDADAALETIRGRTTAAAADGAGEIVAEYARNPDAAGGSKRSKEGGDMEDEDVGGRRRRQPERERGAREKKDAKSERLETRRDAATRAEGEDAPPSPAPRAPGEPFVPRYAREAAAAAERAREFGEKKTPAADREGDKHANLYVRNFPKNFDDRALRRLFSKHGAVRAVLLMKDATLLSPTAIVRFRDAAAAAAAMEATAGAMIEGSHEGLPLHVEYALSREEREAMRAERIQNKIAYKEAKEARRARQEEIMKKNIMHMHAENIPSHLTSDQFNEMFAAYEVSAAKLYYANGPKPSAIFACPAECAVGLVAAFHDRELPGCPAPMKVTLRQEKSAERQRTQARRYGEVEASFESDDATRAKYRDVEERTRVIAAKMRAEIDAERIARRSDRDRARSRPGGGPGPGPGSTELPPRAKPYEYVPRSKRGDDASDASGRRSTVYVDGKQRAYGSRRPGPVAGPDGEINPERPRRAGVMERQARRSGGGGGGGGGGAAEARAKLENATARMRARGKDVAFGGAREERGRGRRRDDFGEGGGWGSGGGKGGGGGRGASYDDDPERTRLSPEVEAQMKLRREEVLRAATGDDQYDWDPAKFERFHKVQLTENHMHSEFISCPIVPGYTREIDRSHMRGEKLLDANKDWIMRVAGIGSDEEYERIKAQTLERHETLKNIQEQQRVYRGESPFKADFIAERKSIADEVAAMKPSNPLAEFARKAADALDANPNWAYDRKIATMKKLMRLSDTLAAETETTTTAAAAKESQSQ